MPFILREEASGSNLLKQNITHAQSDPEILFSMETEFLNEDIKTRQPKTKRIRLDSTNKKGELNQIQEFRKEILEVLGSMKLEQNKILAKIVEEISKLKIKCTEIQNSNIDIEKSVES